MYIDNEIKICFSDVLIKPKRSTLSSRKDVTLERTFLTKNQNSISGIPIIAANMSTGNFNMANIFIKNNMFVAIAKHYNNKWMEICNDTIQDDVNDNDLLKYIGNCFYTIGMCEEEVDQLKLFYNSVRVKGFNPDNIKICIDIANGYSQKFADFVNFVRIHFPNNIIMAGNVCTPEMTQELILAGADIIKIGIGPGSACTTRLKTGVGYPQLSACIENADVAHGLDALICLDGGITCPGDVAKAFGANSDFVMIGGMFAGTDECDGDIITKYEHDGTFNRIGIPIHVDGMSVQLPPQRHMFHYEPNIIEKKYKIWYGMSSDIAPGNKGKEKKYRTSEGRIEEILLKGPVQNIIDDILGGLRSACTYVGASQLKNMGKCTSFVKVGRQHNKF